MIVCVCNAISEKELRDCARKGARTPEDAYAKLGCEVQCGSCLSYADQLMADERGSQRPHLRAVA